MFNSNLIKWLIIVVLALALLLVVSRADAARQGGGHDPVTICHNGHSIIVDDDGAYSGHIHHPDDLFPGDAGYEECIGGEVTTASPTTSPTATPTTSSTVSPTPEPSVSPEPSTEPSTSASPPVSCRESQGGAFLDGECGNQGNNPGPDDSDRPDNADELTEDLGKGTVSAREDAVQPQESRGEVSEGQTTNRVEQGLRNDPRAPEEAEVSSFGSTTATDDKLPDTGGIGIVALGTGVLLVGSGLVARSLIK